MDNFNLYFNYGFGNNSLESYRVTFNIQHFSNTQLQHNNRKVQQWLKTKQFSNA